MLGGEATRILGDEVDVWLCALLAGTVGHERADVLATADYHDTGVGNLGVLVGQRIVNIFYERIVGVRHTFGALSGGRGSERDGLITAYGDAERVAYRHAEGHEAVAVRFGVAEPLRYGGCQLAGFAGIVGWIRKLG